VIEDGAGYYLRVQDWGQLVSASLFPSRLAINWSFYAMRKSSAFSMGHDYNSSTPPPQATSEYLCNHGNISPDSVYLNYALNTQDPLAGHGQKSLDNLGQVSEKYDPHSAT
jgi:hypothetical protein